MPFITVTEEQAKLIAEHPGYLEVRDAKGQSLGIMTHGFTQAEIESAKQRARSDGPWLTTKELLTRLDARIGEKMSQ